MLRVGYAFSENERDCTSINVVDGVRYDHDVRLRPGWNVAFAVTGHVGDVFVHVLRTGKPGEVVPCIELDIGPP